MRDDAHARFWPLALALAAQMGCRARVERLAPPPPAAAAPAPTPIDPRSIVTPLVPIAAGSYRPLFGKGATALAVPAFAIEAHAVTNAQFLAFVRAVPAWQRSQVKRLFADAGYLQHWHGDLDPGRDAAGSPVTHVSWFAARAYAKWAGRRLPTLAQWELAAGDVDEQLRTGRILDWYARPTPAALAKVGSTFATRAGVSDLHGLVWEWVDDFNSALVSGESRGDAGLERNLFCGSGSVGAANPSDYAAFMRYAFRSSLRAGYTVKNLGFRCAADTPAPEAQGGSR